jgi:hypothetical protein
LILEKVLSFCNNSRGPSIIATFMAKEILIAEFISVDEHIKI